MYTICVRTFRYKVLVPRYNTYFNTFHLSRKVMCTCLCTYEGGSKSFELCTERLKWWPFSFHHGNQQPFSCGKTENHSFVICFEAVTEPKNHGWPRMASEDGQKIKYRAIIEFWLWRRFAQKKFMKDWWLFMETHHLLIQLWRGGLSRQSVAEKAWKTAPALGGHCRQQLQKTLLLWRKWCWRTEEWQWKSWPRHYALEWHQ